MTIREETITFPGDTIPALSAFLAAPEGDGPFPAVVVIHEAFGLNDNIRAITRRFAGEGYVALGVDLFAGRSQMVCMFRFFGGMLTNSLEHGGIRDLKASLNHLITLPNVDKNRVGAVGYCMGGSFAIAWAATDTRLKAIAPYYAMNPRPLEAVARSCPVVGSYPESDFTAGAGKKLDTALDGYKVEHDIKVYPGAKHSFFNDQGRSFDPAAAQDSWERVLGFFKAHV
jgi:carboxymethylenebutenolidase